MDTVHTKNYASYIHTTELQNLACVGINYNDVIHTNGVFVVHTYKHLNASLQLLQKNVKYPISRKLEPHYTPFVCITSVIVVYTYTYKIL